jgi:hypothetical protein
MGLVAVMLVPIWSVAYVPTIDGPAHVYNAFVHRNLGNAEYPLFADHYEVDWRPMPNWWTHGVLALLMVPFEPRLAEKLLLSGLVVLFAGAARYFAGSVDRARRWIGYLALPLLYNQLLLLGFYNFAFGLAFYLFAVGFWWRHRTSPSLAFGLQLSLLLLLCWFSHIVSLILALVSIGVLWLFGLRASALGRPFLHPLILAPHAILPLWFYLAHESTHIASVWSLKVIWRYLLGLEVLFLFGSEQKWVGFALAAAFGMLLVLTLAARMRGPRAVLESDGFLALSALAVLLYWVSPEGMSGGTLLKNRLSLFPYLILLPWLAPRLARIGRAAVLVGVAALLIFQIVKIQGWYRSMQPDIRSFVAATEPIPPNSRVLPLLFDRDTESPRFGALGHAIDYVAVEKGLVEWDNYQAASGLFPVRFRAEVGVPDIYAIEAHPGRVDLRWYRPRADYVFTWELDPESRVARQLARNYRRLPEIEVGGAGRVYVRP